MLTQDPSLGELPRADVLVEGDTIAAVGPNLSADGAQVIDAAGDIVIPGFIDTHRHTWETSIRTCAPDYALITYFGGDPRQVRPALPARRRLRGQPVGRPRVRQRGHHDARRLVAHHEHAGPRRRGDPGPPGERASGRSSPSASRNTSLQDWWFGPDYTGSVDDRRRPTPAGSGSSTSAPTTASSRWRLATRGTNFCKPDVVRYEWELAKELGINITVHVAMDRFGYTKMQLTGLRDMDLLYPNTTYVHALAPDRRGVGAGPRLGRQRLVRAPDRAPDGPWLGAGPEGPGATASRSG